MGVQPVYLTSPTARIKVKSYPVMEQLNPTDIVDVITPEVMILLQDRGIDAFAHHQRKTVLVI